MSTVGQIRMQAAAIGANTALSKPGSTPGRTAMPAEFEAFSAALDRSSRAQASSDRSTPQSAMPLAFRRQNLPKMGSQAEDPAKITDAMQQLMAQLAAQGLLNTALQAPNPASPDGNPAGTDSAAHMQSLMTSLGPQQLDAKQSALITQALSRAMKAAGQSAEMAMQSLAASLMQALQQQTLGQSTNQTPAQIASAIQSLAQKNGVTLPPEIQTQLMDLMNKGVDMGSIKLLGVEGAGQQKPIVVLEQAGQQKPIVVLEQAGVVDPAKAANALVSVGEKAVKAKPSDGIFMSGNASDKAAAAKGALVLSASAIDAKGAIEAHSISLNEKRELKDPLDAREFTANTSNLARLDAQNTSNQQKIELKAAEVSLASGPLHEEVMNAAKSGGGRILLELTPPEQGTIRIDLRIDQAGRAHLIVEGASDATKSRLDQGGQNLKNEFAQMGLNLSLDLRQGSQFQQAREQGFSNPRSGFYNSPASISQRSNATLAFGSVRSGDNRDNGNAVHLYA